MFSLPVFGNVVYSDIVWPCSASYLLYSAEVTNHGQTVCLRCSSGYLMLCDSFNCDSSEFSLIKKVPLKYVSNLSLFVVNCLGNEYLMNARDSSMSSVY